MILEVTYPIFHALFHAFSTFSILALKVHFKPVYIKIGSHGKKIWFLFGLGSKVVKVAYCPWGGQVQVLVPLSMGCPLQSVAGLFCLSWKWGRRWPLYSLGVFQSWLWTSWGVYACPCAHSTSPGPCPPEHAHRQLGHHSSRREHFFLWESLNERPVCSQSESFGFGKVSSFQQGRVGTRKELNNTRERRSESERRWEGIGVTKGCTAAPLSSFPNLTGHLVCQTLPELPVAAPPSSWWWPLAA